MYIKSNRLWIPEKNCNFHLLHRHTSMATYATQAHSVTSCKWLWLLRDFGWSARLCVFTCASALQICWDCGFAFPQRDAESTHACVPLQSGLAQRLGDPGCVCTDPEDVEITSRREPCSPAPLIAPSRKLNVWQKCAVYGCQIVSHVHRYVNQTDK